MPTITARRPGPGRRLALLLVGLSATALPMPARAAAPIWSPAFTLEPEPFQSHGLPAVELRRPARFFGILAAGGLLAAWAVDEEDPAAAVRTLDRAPFEAPSDMGNVYGSGWVVGGGALAVWSLGAVAESEQTMHCGRELGQSFLASGILSGVIKYAVGRRRPSGGPHSFPSGHTTSAFSTVPVIHRHLGWAGSVPAILLASSTALGRMEDNRHFLSDVVFGAALGLAVGDAIGGDSRAARWLGSLQVTDRGVGIAIPF